MLGQLRNERSALHDVLQGHDALRSRTFLIAGIVVAGPLVGLSESSPQNQGDRPATIRRRKAGRHAPIKSKRQEIGKQAESPIRRQRPRKPPPARRS